ncbi:MAG: two-component regulator propeller domain-containing protein, partial [Bacteroidia bacterium]
SNTVRAIVEDKKGNIWFGTYGDGLIGYDGKTFTHYTENEGLPSGFIKTVLADRNDNIWMGTEGSGVIKYDGRSFTNYTSDQGLSGDYIIAIYEDKAGNIWFGSDGEGVSRYDGQSFKTYKEEGGLCYNTVQAIMQDKSGKMWFGTDGGGACSFDGEFFKYYSEKQGLSSDYVRSIVEDKEGNIWFGTDGKGLCKLDKSSLSGRRARFERFTTQDGLSNNVIKSILEDAKTGNLWVATEKGLNYLDLNLGAAKDSSQKKSVQVHIFTSANGLKANNFMNNSALIDRNHHAWWGNGKALSTLDLNTFKISEDIPHLQLNAIELEQTYIDFYALADSLKSGHPMVVGDVTKKSLGGVTFSGVAGFYNYPENLELPYNINHLTFHFSALEWSAPDKIRYQYMLQGLDKDWSPPTTDNKALYSNLPSGDYVFKIKATGLSQKWTNEFEYRFSIHPPWWKTWWAYILYVALSAGVLYIVFRWRTAQLRERQKQLEQTVAERTAEVVEQKELIEEKQKEIVDSINYAKRIQRALLASDQMLDTNLKNYFLYFQPKDIVSGDFYWAAHDSADNFVLVTADSTGHGVPGAMMSMLNISCLNEAINERKYTNPAKILNHVRERIIQSLSRDGSLEGGKDGMDCSVAVFDFKNKKLSYAAANNPIWIMRKNAEGAIEVTDLKPDRMPVGKHERDSVSFSEHTVELQEGDMIFTLTDGFADQFGGPKGKKFTNKRLKDLLAHNAAKPLAEQKEAVAKAMERWKFGIEQIDDICLIGVRI